MQSSESPGSTVECGEIDVNVAHCEKQIRKVRNTERFTGNEGGDCSSTAHSGRTIARAVCPEGSWIDFTWPVAVET